MSVYRNSSKPGQPLPKCRRHPDAIMRPVLLNSFNIKGLPMWECPICEILMCTAMARYINEAYAGPYKDYESICKCVLEEGDSHERRIGKPAWR